LIKKSIHFSRMTDFFGLLNCNLLLNIFERCQNFLIYKKENMKRIVLIVLIIINVINLSAQEWKNLRTYKKSTGKEVLSNGNWLKKDRKRNTEIWQKANEYHLSNLNPAAYTNIEQRRDFYKWFDEWRLEKGHEIEWVGVAAIVAGQFANTENWFVQKFVIRNQAIIDFAATGNQTILNDVFPELQQVYFSDSLLIKEAAEIWDSTYGYREQCVIIQPFYEKQDKKAVDKLRKMAKGKGIFFFVVPKSIRFKGDITNCEDRFKHGNIVLPKYYEKTAKH
jgi:hypothetical protein